MCVNIMDAKAVKGSNDAYFCVKQSKQFNKTEVDALSIHTF